MSQEGSEQNRSEQPTPYKLQRARERGMVARGMDLAYFTGLGAFLVYAWLQGDGVRAQIAQSARLALVVAPQALSSEQGLLEVTGSVLMGAARPLGFLMAVIFLVILLFEIAQLGGLVFSTQPLKPDFSRLNPANGLKRIFSVRILVETGKTLLKLGLYGAIAIAVILGAKASAPTLTDAPALVEGMVGAGLRLMGFFVLAALAFAILDQVIARRDFLKKMRMSRREVRREHRDREGDPRLKQRRKSLHKEFAEVSQSLRGLRGADVLVTNPTHFAVALRYDGAKMEAPVVVSRGAHQVALRLRRLAFFYGVAIVESPPLARALFRCELEREIPDALFSPVAEIYRGLQARGALRGQGGAHA